MRGRLRAGTSFAAVLVLAVIVLGMFALLLAKSQRDARDDIEQRFEERPTVAAALTESLFSATTASGQADQADTYGGKVSTQTMDKAIEQGGGNSSFSVLLGEDGKLVAASSGTPQRVIDELEQGPSWVSDVFDGAPYGLSDVFDVGSGKQAIGLATGVITPFERRVLVTGVDPSLLASFIGGYLGEVPPVDDGNAYMLDNRGLVIAAASGDLEPGQEVNVPGLQEAISSGGTRGELPGDEQYASAPVAHSNWSVVTTAPRSSLFATVNGTDRWVPWVIFTLLALAAAAALVLVRRSFADRERLAAGNRELAATQAQLEASHEALERRAKELARSNAELDQFASIASHDLQEPLRKVQAFSSQVISTESDNLSEKGRDYLQRASASALRMQQLIEDLLKFSRVGTHTRPFVPTDLNEIAADVVNDLGQVIREADARVEIGDLPTVPVDPPQLRQLLQNLISNGLKFRREGVEHVVRVDGSVGPRFAEITVSDNGIGFDPEYADRIFRVFERLHGREEYPGTGIGLALCRKIAERHGGTIGAQGRPGEGATFVVRLPLMHEDGDAPPAAAGAEQTESATEAQR